MATPIDVASALSSLPERKERLRKAFADVESKKPAFIKIGATWKDIDDHFKEIENTLRKTLEEYHAKEKAFEAKMKQAQAALDKRDAEVSAKERAALERVQEQKDAAVAEILDQKRKKGSGVSGAAATSSAKKGQASKKQNGSVAQPMDSDGKAAVGASGDTALDSALSGLLAKETVEKDDAAASKDGVTPRPPLRSVCENMNSEALRLLIAKFRRDFNALSAELPHALKCSSDPADLVLKALEGYSPFDHTNREDPVVVANRRACAILLEALTEVLADPVKGVEHPVVPVKHKKSAKRLAETWKSKMNLEGMTGFNFSLDAQCFLQLLAAFGLASDYDPDFLCKLLATIARRKQTPALCRTLGLEAKASDVVEQLIKDNRHVDALAFANGFDLLQRFQPVPLLKSYVREVKKSVQDILKSGNNSSAAQNVANQKEMSALKAVSKAIVEYKLESQYPPASVEERISQLEKEKAEKKRPVPAHKTPQPKKPRVTNEVPGGSVGKAGSAAGPEKPAIHVSERIDYGGRGGSSFGAVTQPGFDRLPLSGYGPAYGRGNFNPTGLPGSYLHPPDGLGSIGFGSPSLLNSPGSYGGYDYRSSLATAPSGYRSYLH